MNMHNADLEITINRKNLFYDTYDQIINKTPLELKKKLYIKYKREEGIDAGGLMK